MTKHQRNITEINKIQSPITSEIFYSTLVKKSEDLSAMFNRIKSYPW